MKIARLALPVALGLLLLAGTLAGLAQAASGQSRETILPGASHPEEIHLGSDGNVWISDYGAGHVYKINPSTGAFTRYDGLSGAVDAQLGPGGYVWWLDINHAWLGRLEIATRQVTTWTMGVTSVWGLTFDSQGRVWVEDYGGSSLIRFDPVSHQRCNYALPNAASGYMIAYAGAIWYGQNTGGLGRLNTTTSQNTFWAFPVFGFGAWDVAASDTAGVWIVDDSHALVGRVDPNLNTLTYYTSTLLTQDSKVLPRGHSIWFTDAGGWVVALDPAAATSTVIPITATTSTVSSVCVNAGAGRTHTAATAAGTLVFSSGTLTSTLQNGMTHYALPAGSDPYGLADVHGDLWFVDINRRTVTILASAHKLYLPLAHR